MAKARHLQPCGPGYCTSHVCIILAYSALLYKTATSPADVDSGAGGDLRGGLGHF